MNRHSEVNNTGQVVQLSGLGDPAEHEHHKQTNPFKRLHTLLRGRYAWAFVLAAIGGIGLGALAWTSVELVYQSTGMIRVRPVVPTVLYKNEDSGVMPMFRNFVESQQQLMESPRVISMAMESDEWRQVGEGMSPEARHEFQRKLQVKRGRGQILAVSFSDPNREATLAAVEAVIDAYMRLYGERDVREETQRLRVLEERRTALSNQLDSLKSRIRVIADEYGSDALARTYQFKLEELHKFESALKEAQLQLAAAAGAKKDAANAESGRGHADDAVDELDPATMSVERIAQYDGKANRLLEQKKSLQTALDLLELRFGEGHREVKLVRARRESLEKQLDERVRWFRDNYTEAELRAASPIRGAGPGGRASVKVLEQRVAQLEKLYQDARQDTLTLGRKKLEIDGLKEEAERIKARLDETRFRIEQLNIESAVSGRLEVISEGETRPGPINAGKRKKRAALGVMGGSSLGIGIILLLGLKDRRLHGADDAEINREDIRMLGLLPELPEDLSDPEQAVAAGYCVHHIRAMLQINVHNPQRVIAVTSGTSGSGKTSLALSLGLSYGSCGSRTLLIDADFHGSGLTRRLEAIKRRRIGHILRQHGFISEEQLEHALELSRDTGQPLGTSLVSMGVLTQSDIDHALSVQESSPVGLLDTLKGEALNECVAETGIPGVEILPIGGARAWDTSRVSPDSMRRLLDQAAQAYDIVIVDSGPVPGSIESSIVAAAADAVVPIFARGEDRYSAQRCLDFLLSINAKPAGVVFNRATGQDLARSSLSTAWSKAEEAQAEVEDADFEDATVKRASHFGPVAYAVVKSSRRS